MRHRVLAFCLLIAFAPGHVVMTTGCRSSARTEPVVRFYDGYGGYARDITTHSPEAQKWFNQGIQLLYGFNHDEAIRSFQEATKHDPDCAMAWWGIAYANGLHVNNPVMNEKQSTQAWEASREALKHRSGASPVEQALIDAVAARYAWPIPEDRKPLDEAYAAGMEKAYQAFPNDADVGALYAEAMMDLQPWDYWTTEGEPKGRALEIVSVLERVMQLDPDHPGALHFYIHAVEASNAPERAEAAADQLGGLVPGSGHLVHMPSHIYARVARWADAADSNIRAIAADRAYFAVAPPPDFYSLYYVHNIHFLSWVSQMEGRYEAALAAARELERDIPESFLREWTFVADGFMPATYHVMVRFGKWDDILAEPRPDDYRLVSVALWHYARGVACSAKGEIEQAKAELESFERAAAAIPSDWKVGNNKASDVMQVARRMLNGELAYREGRLDAAFAALREGVVLEDALVYSEPPDWMQPVRHALGALLMGAGRHAEAEQVYRDDLTKYKGNGWSLLGLEKSLRAQGKHVAADDAAGERVRAWARADVAPTSSCYCEPGR